MLYYMLDYALNAILYAMQHPNHYVTCGVGGS